MKFILIHIVGYVKVVSLISKIIYPELFNFNRLFSQNGHQSIDENINFELIVTQSLQYTSRI